MMEHIEAQNKSYQNYNKLLDNMSHIISPKDKLGEICTSASKLK